MQLYPNFYAKVRRSWSWLAPPPTKFSKLLIHIRLIVCLIRFVLVWCPLKSFLWLCYTWACKNEGTTREKCKIPPLSSPYSHLQVRDFFSQMTTTPQYLTRKCIRLFFQGSSLKLLKVVDETFLLVFHYILYFNLTEKKPTYFIHNSILNMN